MNFRNHFSVPLLLTLMTLFGCTEQASTTDPPTDDTTPVPMVDCDGNVPGTPRTFRIGALRVPTSADVDSGNTLGHNIDRIGTICDTPDYVGGVDNSLIDLAATLTTLGEGGLDLNAEIASALACDGTDCTPLAIDIVVTPGTICADIEVRDGDGSVLAGPFRAASTGSTLEGRVDELDLTIPYDAGFQCDDGAECTVGGAACSDASTCAPRSVDIELTVSDVIFSADLGTDSLDEIVLGGALEQTSFETTITAIVPLISSDISTQQVLGILSGLYDVQLGGSTCDGLSVGLLASAPESL